MYQTPPAAAAEADRRSAKYLALAAIILYAIFGGFTLLIGLAAASEVLIFFGSLPFFLLILTVVTVYIPLSEGMVAEARNFALALGIISIFIGGIISGILLIVAYAKANSAYRAFAPARRVAPPAMAAVESTPGALSSSAMEEAADAETPNYCPSCGVKLRPEYNFCNNCGHRLA